jgi:GNAT superfamily N-acetyltransferase
MGTTRAVRPVHPVQAVRPAVPDDAPRVAELLGHLGYPRTEDEVRTRLQRLSSSHDDVVAVSDRGEGVVGFVAAHMIPLVAEPEEAYVRIIALVVDPAAQGHGIGRQLVDFVEHLAQRRGCRLLEVSSGRRPEREAAHRFYAALGFTDTSETSTRYWKRLEGLQELPDRDR